MRRVFTLSEEDWKALIDASASARSTPVILVAGVDASATAHKRVMNLWDEMGEKYGFIPSTVDPTNNEALRQIQAEPVAPIPPQVALNKAIEDHDRGAS